MSVIRKMPKAVMVLGLLGMVIGGSLLASCKVSVERQAEALAPDGCELPKEDGTVDMTDKSVLATAPIPPLDASAPAVTETATFALG